MTIDAAIEVFVTAFSEGRSFARAHQLERINGLWVMRDPPGARNPRKTEIVSSGLSPKESVRRAQECGVGWHFLCHVHGLEDDFEGVRRAYKSMGYRALSTEWLFVHNLESIPVFESDPPARRVQTSEELKTLKQVASQPRKLRSNWRLYGVWDDERDYGWVDSVPVGDNAWVSGLHVHNGFRGRGFGRALMSRLLLDDKELGVKSSVLLASSDGARLYPHLGYEKIGILQMFCPAKRG